uniref:Uncharacterized protein n=1 Tax=Setaria italica TaxID=4555 RepID=K3ZEZ6_SETIT
VIIVQHRWVCEVGKFFSSSRTPIFFFFEKSRTPFQLWSPIRLLISFFRKIKLANGRGEERSVRKRGRQRESVPGTRLTRRAHAATSPLPSLGFPFPETHPCRGQKPPVTSPIPASPFTPSSPVPFHTPPTQPLRRTYILPSALSSPRQPASLIPSNAAENPQALAAAQMFLTDKYSSLLPPHHHHSDAAPPKASNRRRQQRQLLTGKAACFDAALAARLRALLPLPGPASSSSPLAALARLADLLALTLAEAAQALAGEGDAAAVAAHLDAGVALLDACNAITARLERLRRRRLLARFALHLVASSSTGRARVALADRDDRSSASPPPPLPSLPFDQPRGRLSAAARVLVAVNAVSSLAAAAAAAVLGGDALATVFPRQPGRNVSVAWGAAPRHDEEGRAERRGTGRGPPRRKGPRVGGEYPPCRRTCSRRSRHATREPARAGRHGHGAFAVAASAWASAGRSRPLAARCRPSPPTRAAVSRVAAHGGRE